MEILYQVLGLASAGLLVWFTWNYIKKRPDAFSRDNLTKSFGTMGVLALILIAFVAFLVFLLNIS